MKRFIPILVGIIFLAVGIFLYFQNQRLTKVCTAEAEATVVNMQEEMENDENGMRYVYYPVIEYKAGSETVRVTMSSGSSTPAYSINDKLTILYNPNKVKEFIVKGDKASGIFSYVFMGLGVLVTGCGVVIALKKNY